MCISERATIPVWQKRVNPPVTLSETDEVIHGTLQEEQEQLLKNEDDIADLNTPGSSHRASSVTSICTSSSSDASRSPTTNIVKKRGKPTLLIEMRELKKQKEEFHQKN